MTDRRRVNLSEFYATAVPDQLVCPGCGCRRFVVTNTYWVQDLDSRKRTKRRLRQCAECGFAQTETVKPPVIGGETTVSEEDLTEK
jgi:hypothetical protein